MAPGAGACCYACTLLAPGSLLLLGVFVSEWLCVCVLRCSFCALRLAGLTGMLPQPWRISHLSIVMLLFVFEVVVWPTLVIMCVLCSSYGCCTFACSIAS
jgi:hypothetical protein